MEQKTENLKRCFPLKSESLTYSDIETAQERLIKIAVIVRDILEKNKVPYCITLGTLIGAVRHKGFIPWDVDFDMMVEECYYEQAVSCIKKEIPNWLIVQDQDSDPNYCACWIKIVDRYSEIHVTAFESDNQFTYRGLSVDLYKLVKTKKSNVANALREENIAYFKRKHERGLISAAILQKKLEQMQKNDFDIDITNNADEERYIFLHFINTTRDRIYPPVQYEFEGELFAGPHNYDKFLKDCYYKSDYMIPPDYEERDIKIDRITFY